VHAYATLEDQGPDFRAAPAIGLYYVPQDTGQLTAPHARRFPEWTPYAVDAQWALFSETSQACRRAAM